MNQIILFAAFALGFFLVLAIAEIIKHNMRRRYLLGWLSESDKQNDSRSITKQLINIFSLLGRKRKSVTIQKDNQEISLLRSAGFRHQDMQAIYRGMRIFSMISFSVLSFLFFLLKSGINMNSLVMIYCFCVTGYFIPKIILKWLSKKRKIIIFKELPDVLDILLICVDAGLTFDQGLRRVQEELNIVTPKLANEFQQYLLEVESGLPRKQALENISKRNSTECLTNVTNVLIQSAKYGTDISVALRRMADNLRIERRMKAEEKATTVATKLVFPTILLIMPALMLIVLGPAIIMVIKQISSSF